MGQDVHSGPGNNNIVLLHLWWSETMLKDKKILDCFVSGNLENILSLLLILTMHENPKMFLSR